MMSKKLKRAIKAFEESGYLYPEEKVLNIKVFFGGFTRFTYVHYNRLNESRGVDAFTEKEFFEEAERLIKLKYNILK